MTDANLGMSLPAGQDTPLSRFGLTPHGLDHARMVVAGIGVSLNATEEEIETVLDSLGLGLEVPAYFWMNPTDTSPRSNKISKWSS